MIVLSDREACTGCSACAMICPVQSIHMTEDEEGFLYPSIDPETCIHCGRCEQVCPVKEQGTGKTKAAGKKQAPEKGKSAGKKQAPEKGQTNGKERAPEEGNIAGKEHARRGGQEAYVVQNRDEQICRESTSGGAFTAIAGWVIDRGGVVFGASLQEDLTVGHRSAQTREDLRQFRNSKYVQSRMGETFREAKSYLEEGRWVCFSGTPCQIEGFRAFLGRDYDTLLCVDVVCRAVPSPLILRKYLEMQRGRLGDLARIRFREKHHGYKYSALALFDPGGRKVYARGIDSDQMLRAFFSNICNRPSCYHCHFKKRYRVSDITLWDCFDVFLYDRKMDNDRGATSVLIHTEQGRKVFSRIRDQLYCVPVSADCLTAGTTEMFRSVPENPGRKAFFEDAARLTGEELFTRYFPETARVRCERLLRGSMCRLGIYAPVNRVYKRLKRLKRAADQKKKRS